MKKILSIFIVLLCSILLFSCNIDVSFNEKTENDYYHPSNEILTSKINDETLSFENIYIFSDYDGFYLQYKRIKEIKYYKYSYDKYLADEYYTKYIELDEQSYEAANYLDELLNNNISMDDQIYIDAKNRHDQLGSECSKYKKCIDNLINQKTEITKNDFDAAVSRAGKEFQTFIGLPPFFNNNVNKEIIDTTKYNFFEGQKIITWGSPNDTIISNQSSYESYTYFESQLSAYFTYSSHKNSYSQNSFQYVNESDLSVSNTGRNPVAEKKYFCVPICTGFTGGGYGIYNILDTDGLYVEYQGNEVIRYKIIIQTEEYKTIPLIIYNLLKTSIGSYKNFFKEEFVNEINQSDKIYFELPDDKEYNIKIVGNSLILLNDEILSVKKGYSKIIITDEDNTEMNTYTVLVK